MALAHVGLAITIGVAGRRVTGEGSPPDVLVPRAIFGEDDVECVGERDEYFEGRVKQKKHTRRRGNARMTNSIQTNALRAWRSRHHTLSSANSGAQTEQKLR